MASESQPIDYETLLTRALESTARDATKREKSKRNKYMTIISTLIVIIAGILCTVAFTTTEENNEIKSFQKDIDTLHTKVESIENSADHDTLYKDIIEEKERTIDYIKKDQDLDDDTKHQMVQTTEDEIKELKKVMEEEHAQMVLTTQDEIKELKKVMEEKKAAQNSTKLDN
jgi:ABC-type nickel/cobalt efflux system permease component RcnA